VEGGANDVTNDDEYIGIFAPMDSFKEISSHLKETGIELEEAELRYQPKQEIELDVEKTLKVMHVVDLLEELDDVQSVFTNLNVSDEALKALEAE